jgi:cytochrome c556
MKLSVVLAFSATILFAHLGIPVHAHEIVPGPFGDIVDHQKPLAFKNDDERIRYARQQQMRAFSAHFRAVEAAVSYNAPVEALVPTNTNALAELARTLPQLFRSRIPMEPERHGAKPAIWDEPQRFALHVTGFQDATSALVKATQEGAALLAPLQAVRHQCLACHQSFRVFAPR